MKPEIHSEAMSLYKELNLIPAVCPFAVFERAMAHGYSLAVSQMTKKIKGVTSELIKRQENSK